MSPLAAIGLVLAGTAIAVDTAEARGRHRRHAARAQGYTPPFAAIVVDANTGKVLFAQNEHAARHPASVTKVMTLYMLFELLERGKISLDSDIRISQHAASMAPSKLGLRPGSTIEVEDAIKALVTKSANDIAAAVAEFVGGSEERFAEMMTAKAKSLGMSRTNFANASGLPDPQQITTAHDLAILGRAIQDRFPKYFPYFSTHQFAYRGSVMRNHNHLLGRVEGVDGIKTGYTRASGFNLLTSAKLGNRRIVSVVLGGKSAGARDRIVASLVDRHLESASPIRTAAPIVESGMEVAKLEPRAVREVPVAQREAAREMLPPARIEAARPVAVAAAPAVRPEPRALAFATPTMAAAALAPSQTFVQPVATERPRPAVIASATRSDDKVATIPTERRISLDGSTRPVAAAAGPTTQTTTPAPLRWVAGPSGQTKTAAAQPAPTRGVDLPKEKHPNRVDTTVVARAEAPKTKPEPAKAEPARPAAARAGAMIQVGATPTVSEANELLARARGKARVLSGATAFTEKVQKGSETLFRARFAGLSDSQADAACKNLRRTGVSCFTTKN